jgi:hypothetical protein
MVAFLYSNSKHLEIEEATPFIIAFKVWNNDVSDRDV